MKRAACVCFASCHITVVGYSSLRFTPEEKRNFVCIARNNNNVSLSSLSGQLVMSLWESRYNYLNINENDILYIIVIGMA